MTESRDHNRGAKAITFDVKKVDNIQTDFEKKGNPGYVNLRLELRCCTCVLVFKKLLQ